MKKFLLSAMAMMTIAMSANAQNFGAETPSFVKLEREASNVNLVTEKSQGIKKIKAGETLLTYLESEESLDFEKTAKYQSAERVGAMFNDLMKYKNYEVLGLRFAVVCDLGPTGMAFVYSYKNDRLNFQGEYNLPSGKYEISEIDKDNNLTVKWNEVYFDQTYKIGGRENGLQYGIAFTMKDRYPQVIGKTTMLKDDYMSDLPSCYGLYVTLNGKKQWGSFANDKNPFTPAFQIIAKDPNGQTVIFGVNGASEPVAFKYYSPDGKELSAPQKGLNIIKMSDGTSRKVYVK